MRCLLTNNNNKEKEANGAFPVRSAEASSLSSSWKRRKSGSKNFACIFKCSSSRPVVDELFISSLPDDNIDDENGNGSFPNLSDGHREKAAKWHAEFDDHDYDDDDYDDSEEEQDCPNKKSNSFCHENRISPPPPNSPHNTPFDISLPSPTEDQPNIACELGRPSLNQPVHVFHSAGFMADSTNIPLHSHDVFEDDDDSGTKPSQSVDDMVDEDVRQILRLPPYTIPHHNINIHLSPSVESIGGAAADSATTTTSSSNGTTPYFHRQASMRSMGDSTTKSLLFGEQVSITDSLSSPVRQNRGEQIDRLLTIPTQVVDSRTVRMDCEGKTNDDSMEEEATPPLLISPVLPSTVNALNCPSDHARSCSGSTFSSVSSFLVEGTGDFQNTQQLKNYRIDDNMQLRNNDNNRNKTLLQSSVAMVTPPRPSFFWRSHPNVTITSYNHFQRQKPRQPKQRIRLRQKGESKLTISKLPETIHGDDAVNSISTSSATNSKTSSSGSSAGQGISNNSPGIVDENLRNNNTRTSSAPSSILHEASISFKKFATTIVKQFN